MVCVVAMASCSCFSMLQMRTFFDTRYQGKESNVILKLCVRLVSCLWQCVVVYLVMFALAYVH